MAGRVFSSKPGNFNKKGLAVIIKNEYSYISNLFDVLDLKSLSQKRKLCDEDDDYCENFAALNTSDKLFKKNKTKKGGVPIKGKSFPQTIDGLEKELEELKGTPMTYQKKLRKQGLQSRLNKKRKKDDIKLKKALLKQSKKGFNVVNGPLKMTKPILNSDGDVVSNKFDFADKEFKKENKKKLATSVDVNMHQENISKKRFCSSNSSESMQNNTSEDIKVNSNISTHETRKGDVDKTIKVNKKQEISKFVKSEEEIKPPIKQSIVFNKENKMVFSKVNISDNARRHKKKAEKDPSKILLKLKEDSKKILNIQKENKEKADLILEKQKWKTALMRASGEKVRDDPELLKKSIAKDKSKKLKSQKTWQARLDRVQKEKDDRQKKRTENIQTRKNEKKKKKFKKAIKKGSFVQV